MFFLVYDNMYLSVYVCVNTHLCCRREGPEGGKGGGGGGAPEASAAI